MHVLALFHVSLLEHVHDTDNTVAGIVWHLQGDESFIIHVAKLYRSQLYGDAA